MKIFIAGATGAIGRRLVPQLVERGHAVVGTTRSSGKADILIAAGAEPVVVDGLDRAGMTDAVEKAAPDVIVHQLTALSGPADLRKFDRVFATTNRLRTEGTDNLLAAARASGVGRFVAQSYTGWPNERVGGAVKTEADPLDANPPGKVRTTLDAIRYLESTVGAAPDIDGLVLRYGTFYGPGTPLATGGEIAEAVRKRRFPLIGNGEGVWSFIHIDDAAAATVAAIERGEPGIYNVVDDDPAPVREWLPALAAAVGAKRPMRVPAWFGRVAVGPHAVAMMTEMRGSSNAKAKRALGWQPAYATWRDGFRAVMT